MRRGQPGCRVLRLPGGAGAALGGRWVGAGLTPPRSGPHTCSSPLGTFPCVLAVTSQLMRLLNAAPLLLKLDASVPFPADDGV